MVKYSVRGLNKETSAKASAENLTVHFKNIVEVAQAVKHKTLTRAKAYLKNVLAHKEAIPINTHKLGRGRPAQVSGPARYPFLPPPPPSPPRQPAAVGA